MKKRMICMVIAMAFMLSGCGQKAAIHAEDYIELGQYKGLEVSRMNTVATEEEINQQISIFMDSYTEAVPVTDRTDVRVGDTANIDYVGKIDGVAFAGGTADGYDLTIGSGRFIPGFEEGLVGVKVGETVDLNLKFPDDYSNNSDIAGKDAVFTVTVNSISMTPELTDELINTMSNGQYTSVADFKQYIRDYIEGTNKIYADSDMYTSLLNMASENAKIKQPIPESYIQEKKDDMIQSTQSRADSYNMELNEYVEKYMGLDEATFKEKVEEASGKLAKEGLVVQAIANKEGLSVSDEDFDSQIEEYVKMYGYKDRKDLEEHMSVDTIKEAMLTEKVEQLLADEAVITIQNERK